MLRAGRMDEFVTEEEEPWYDQRDLEQGEPRCVCEEDVNAWEEDDTISFHARVRARCTCALRSIIPILSLVFTAVLL